MQSKGAPYEWEAPLSCRPAHLKRTFTNRIDNAARYGRVQIWLTVPDPADPGTAGTLRMEIEDEGPGIPPQDIAVLSAL